MNSPKIVMQWQCDLKKITDIFLRISWWLWKLHSKYNHFILFDYYSSSDSLVFLFRLWFVCNSKGLLSLFIIFTAEAYSTCFVIRSVHQFHQIPWKIQLLIALQNFVVVVVTNNTVIYDFIIMQSGTWKFGWTAEGTFQLLNWHYITLLCCSC